MGKEKDTLNTPTFNYSYIWYVQNDQIQSYSNSFYWLFYEFHGNEYSKKKMLVSSDSVHLLIKLTNLKR